LLKSGTKVLSVGIISDLTEKTRQLLDIDPSWRSPQLYLRQIEERVKLLINTRDAAIKFGKRIDVAMRGYNLTIDELLPTSPVYEKLRSAFFFMQRAEGEIPPNSTDEAIFGTIRKCLKVAASCLTALTNATKASQLPERAQLSRTESPALPEVARTPAPKRPLAPPPWGFLRRQTE
jgi:hypothetical protein